VPFTEDLSVFFSTDDFAVAATLQGVAVNGIFDETYMEPIGNVVEGRAPIFTCATTAIPAVSQGQTLVIGARTFKVRGVEPDGTGVTRLRLEEQ
jgi:hypothetical protein